jgi:surface protein
MGVNKKGNIMLPVLALRELNLTEKEAKRRLVEGDGPDEPTSFLDLPGVLDPVFEKFLLSDRNEYAVDLPTEASTKAKALKAKIMGFCGSVTTFQQLCREQLSLYLKTEILRIENEVLPRLWNAAKDDLDQQNDWEITNLGAPFDEPESYELAIGNKLPNRPKIRKTMRNLSEWNVWDVASRRNGMHDLKHLRLINTARRDANGTFFTLPDGKRIDLSEDMVLKILVHVWGMETWASRHMVIYQPVDMYRDPEDEIVYHVPIDETNHGPYEALDMSKVTNLMETFQMNRDFNLPIGAWDVSNVESMLFTFHGADSFNQPIGAWNVSNVTETMGTFQDATSFDQPIGDWDVSKVRDFSQMFYNASSFNQPIGEWKVSNATDMSVMFYEASSFNQSLREWSLYNVIYENMFEKALNMDPDNYPWICKRLSAADWKAVIEVDVN